MPCFPYSPYLFSIFPLTKCSAFSNDSNPSNNSLTTNIIISKIIFRSIGSLLYQIQLSCYLNEAHGLLSCNISPDLSSGNLSAFSMHHAFSMHQVHTVLRAESTRDFGIMLSLWDEMAEIASMHLRRNDVIYVSGRLRSYTQASEDGETKTKFQVNVKELNYVAPILRPYHPAEPEVKKSGIGSLESQKYRLYLWQIFFANPCDWWDNRKRKAHSRLPDFRHKDTNEALWLSPNDPPWVKRQLELLDLGWEQGCSTHARSKNVVPWNYDEEYIGRLLGVELHD